MIQNNHIRTAKCTINMPSYPSLCYIILVIVKNIHVHVAANHMFLYHKRIDVTYFTDPVCGCTVGVALVIKCYCRLAIVLYSGFFV